MKKETWKKGLPVLLISALAASPTVAVPKAYALDYVSVEADDNEAGVDSGYTIEFDLEEDLDSGEYITIRFDSDFELDADEIDVDSVTVNDEEPDSVSVNENDNTIKIKVPYDLEAGDTVTVEITGGITNPDDEDTYYVEVKTSQETTYESDSVYIEGDDSSSSDDFEVDVDDDEAGAETAYTINEFDLRGSDELEAGDWVYVTFPDSDMLPSDIDESDVEINDEEPDQVKISGKEVQIKLPDEVEGDDYIKIEFSEDAGIQNPDEADDYVIEVEYNNRTYTSDTFEITDDSGTSSSDYTVSLSDNTAGARSSYSFDIDLGNKRLSSNEYVTVEFPSADMLPSYMNAADVQINGSAVRTAAVSGNKVYLTTPYGFGEVKTVKVNFSYNAFIKNPQTAGTSYQLATTIGGKTYRSKSFSITGTSVTTPTTVDNSTATISLSKTTPSTATAITVGIKGLGMPLLKNRDFLELALPSGFRVPSVINASTVSVNGLVPSYVAARGQNLVIYPSQDIAAATPVTVVVSEGTNIATPATPSLYSIGVYTSAEKNLLFARPVTIAPPVPANAPRLKLNVKSYTVSNKTFTLAAAPYTYNDTTLVPAQFFKDALSLTTKWNKSTADVISGNTTIHFTVGSNQAKVNNTVVKLPVPVQIKDGMPMLPIRFIADTLKYKLGWDEATKSIVIYK